MSGTSALHGLRLEPTRGHAERLRTSLERELHVTLTPQRADGLLIDYAGVMTSSVSDALVDFETREHVDGAVVRAVVLGAYQNPNGPIARLETGRSRVSEVDAVLAREIGRRIGHPLESARLCERLLQGLVTDEAMMRAVRKLRSEGVRTGLLSNSWGVEGHDMAELALTFDVVILSRDIGLRKPDPRVFSYALQELGVRAAETTFVDDLPSNVEAAAALGLHARIHLAAAPTLAWLEERFVVPLCDTARTK
jgi:putative hydrolase of the HAD superfamily